MKKSALISLTATLLALAFLISQSGCVRWHRHERPTSALPKLTEGRADLYLVESRDAGAVMWQFHGPLLTNDSLTGDLIRVSETMATRILNAGSAREARIERNRVLLFLRNGPPILASDHNIPLSRITRIESFDVDAGATIAITMLTMAVCVVVLTVIIALTKSSCPFVYSRAPDGNHFEGELFSGAIYPQLQRHDRLPLLHLRPVEGNYRVILANKAHEVQTTDLLRLIAVDHPENTRPLFDKYGTLHTIIRPQLPIAAHDLNGSDVRDLLLARDDKAWGGDPKNMREAANDGIDLVFLRPPGAMTAKLVISARNSFWMDHVYLLLLDEEGSLAPEIEEHNMSAPGEALRRWSSDQRLPLAVWLWTSSGTWERADQFELSGPMAWREDVLPLDLHEVAGDSIHLRLDCGFQFWEVDQVALDLVPDTLVTMREVAAERAVDLNGVDVREQLRAEDGKGYVQPEVDDAAEVVFPVPDSIPGMQRSLFLHGAGHYHILHDPVKWMPDPFYLGRFKQPDALSNYSRERWNEIEHSNVMQPL